MAKVNQQVLEEKLTELQDDGIPEDLINKIN